MAISFRSLNGDEQRPRTNSATIIGNSRYCSRQIPATLDEQSRLFERSCNVLELSVHLVIVDQANQSARFRQLPCRRYRCGVRRRHTGRIRRGVHAELYAEASTLQRTHRGANIQLPDIRNRPKRGRLRRSWLRG